MIVLDRIPAIIRLEDALFCQQCQTITEAKYSVEECCHCTSKAIVPLSLWLDAVPVGEG